MYLYETADGEVHEVPMTVAEMMRREKGGRIRLADGRRAVRLYGLGRHMASRNVDKSSVALAVPCDDPREVLTEDRRINPNSAPNYYDAGGVPHWRGDAIAVRQRKRQYCQERGLAWNE